MKGVDKISPSRYTYIVRKREKGKKMKRYEIKKQSRTFGSNCDWYNKQNLESVETANPTYPCGNRRFPAAYFVFETEQVRDEMRDFNPNYKVSRPVAGPFASENEAQEQIKEY